MWSFCLLGSLLLLRPGLTVAVLNRRWPPLLLLLVFIFFLGGKCQPGRSVWRNMGQIQQGWWAGWQNIQRQLMLLLFRRQVTHAGLAEDSIGEQRYGIEKERACRWWIKRLCPMENVHEAWTRWSRFSAWAGRSLRSWRPRWPGRPHNNVRKLCVDPWEQQLRGSAGLQQVRIGDLKPEKLLSCRTKHNGPNNLKNQIGTQRSKSEKGLYNLLSSF